MLFWACSDAMWTLTFWYLDNISACACSLNENTEFSHGPEW